MQRLEIKCATERNQKQQTDEMEHKTTLSAWHVEGDLINNIPKKVKYRQRQQIHEMLVPTSHFAHKDFPSVWIKFSTLKRD